MTDIATTELSDDDQKRFRQLFSGKTPAIALPGSGMIPNGIRPTTTDELYTTVESIVTFLQKTMAEKQALENEAAHLTNDLAAFGRVLKRFGFDTTS